MNVLVAVEAFLAAALPAGTEIIAGQQNRISEPTGTFVVMTPLLQARLGTNLNVNADVAFAGSVDGTTLTVSSIRFGAIAIGAPLFGPDIAEGTTILSQESGEAGGAGLYALSAAQTAGATPLAAGRIVVTQPTRIDVQIDVHSPRIADGADMLRRVTTLFRSDFGVETLAPLSPLYASDARQIPFSNGENQVESRWTVDLSMQSDEPVAMPQQFADVVDLTFVPLS